MRLLRYAGVAFAFWACACGALGATNAVPWRLPSYTLTAREMPVRQALETFGVAQGIPVLMSKSVGGVVSGNFENVPALAFLDRIATINNLVWYYDGATLYVNGASETVTTLIDLKYLKAGELGVLLRQFGVEDDRFPIKAASDGELIMVSGPPRYVQLVSELIERADNLREMRTFNEVEVRLFPLTYTWADNVTISVSTPESSVSIQGVATMLSEMTKVAASESISAVTNADGRVERLQERVANRVQPVVRPENRLNAVIVRDSKTRMPMYERLIRQLDRPVKLVEITITTVELSKKDAFEWQSSLAVSRSRETDHETQSGRAGMNIDNLMSEEGLSGKGASVAYSYVGDNFTVDASLSALEAQSKTRSISRTAILTMNNFAASITDTQTYNARVTGEKVANLQSVSAGTTFSAKPRAIKGSPTNGWHDVWMVLQITDGGFEAQSVDGMPMSRNTTLTTQTMLREGQSLVLAGYVRDVKGESRWGIPWLRSLPFIGWLFGGTGDSLETVQRMFVLTPRVIVATPDTPLEQVLTNRDLSDVDRLGEAADRSDRTRKLRELELSEARTIELERTEDKLRRRGAEIDRDRKIRQLERRMERDALREERREWRNEYDAMREAYERGDYPAPEKESN